MASRKGMQMIQSFLFASTRGIDGNKRIRADCEMKVANFIATSKAGDLFSKGKGGRDVSAELLIPVHITEKW